MEKLETESTAARRSVWNAEKQSARNAL